MRSWKEPVVRSSRTARPIDQGLGILAGSHKQAEAKRFVEFILRGGGQELLAEYGYRQPVP
jgi:ABC-type molybdate transport system substrate-binding protein